MTARSWRRRPSASLRAIGLPRPLLVRADAEGHPVAVTRTGVHGRHGDEARVENIEEVWRVAEEWWRDSAQARTYYRVVLAGGRALTIFRDDTSPAADGAAWFEQGYVEPHDESTSRVRER